MQERIKIFKKSNEFEVLDRKKSHQHCEELGENQLLV